MFPIDVATATTGTQLGKHYFQTKINYSTPSPREEKCKIEQKNEKENTNSFKKYGISEHQNKGGKLY